MSVFMDEHLETEIHIIWKTQVYPYLLRNWDRQKTDKLLTWKTWELFKNHHLKEMS